MTVLAQFYGCFLWLPAPVRALVATVFVLFIVAIVLRIIRFILDLIPFV